MKISTYIPLSCQSSGPSAAVPAAAPLPRFFSDASLCPSRFGRLFVTAQKPPEALQECPVSTRQNHKQTAQICCHTRADTNTHTQTRALFHSESLNYTRKHSEQERKKWTQRQHTLARTVTHAWTLFRDRTSTNDL